MLYMCPFLITRSCTNGTVSLQIFTTEVRYNIRRSKPYKSDTQVEDFSSKHMYDNFNILSPVIYFCLNTKAWIQSM